MSISANYPNVRPSLLLDFANSQQLDPRVTFSRSTTAPYYDGKTSVLAEQNLQIYSQAIGGTGWSLNQITANLNNAVAPDGTTTMSQLIENVTTASHYLNLASGISFTSGLSYTISVYMQIGVGATAPSIMQVWANSFVATAYANFNISTNAVANTNNCTAVISQVGSSTIYRCSITITATSTTSTTNLGIAFTNNNSALGFVPSYLGVVTSDVKVWGFQLEQRSSVTAYNATTTSALTNYIPQLLTAPINAPRFDFNPTTGESFGLLIEQSSTNLLTYSQDFTNAAWNKARCSITPNANIALDGTQTMQLLVEDTTASNSHATFRTVTGFVSGTSYTFYAYIKPYGRTQANLAVSNTAFPSTTNVYFDISAGTIVSSTNATGTITAEGNGVYRCTLTATASASGSGDVYIQPAVSGSTIYTGNGYSGIYIWGAQLEALAFPTSYIPTTSAQVTRASDNASMTGTNFSSWYNQSQGTFYMDFKSIYSGSASPQTRLIYFSNNGQIPIYTNNGGNGVYSYDGTSASQQTGLTFGTRFQITSSYGSAGKQLVLNASAVATSTYNNAFANQANIYIGNDNAGTNQANGWIKKMAYYPIQVTASQSQALTGS